MHPIRDCEPLRCENASFHYCPHYRAVMCRVLRQRFAPRSRQEGGLAGDSSRPDELSRGGPSKRLRDGLSRGSSKRLRASEMVCEDQGHQHTMLSGENYTTVDGLPDDVLISIMVCISSRASSPRELLSVMLTCKRFYELGHKNPEVWAKASVGALSVRAGSWSEGAYRHMKRCAEAGNVEACYMLGMIRFYCLSERAGGVSLLAKAAMAGHAEALFALAVIEFNGSGGRGKDLRAGARLCARAARLGHVDATRELGHCLQDGYGVRRDEAEGRRLLAAAVAAEEAERGGAVIWDGGRRRGPLQVVRWRPQPGGPRQAPAHAFLRDWFGLRGGVGMPGGEDGELRLCSQPECGRPETRKHEFRRCSHCAAAHYCSRACQARHWKLRHRHDCLHLPQLAPGGGGQPHFHIVHIHHNIIIHQQFDHRPPGPPPPPPPHHHHHHHHQQDPHIIHQQTQKDIVPSTKSP